MLTIQINNTHKTSLIEPHKPKAPKHPTTHTHKTNDPQHTTMGDLSTPNNLPTTLQRNLPCSSKSFSSLSTWEEPWAKVTKLFATMLIYKTSILFFVK